MWNNVIVIHLWVGVCVCVHVIEAVRQKYAECSKIENTFIDFSIGRNCFDPNE